MDVIFVGRRLRRKRNAALASAPIAIALSYAAMTAFEIGEAA